MQHGISSDSLDSILAQFELVNVSAVSESMPDTPPPQSPLAAFFQRSSFRGFRESPRPAAVTSPQPHSATRDWNSPSTCCSIHVSPRSAVHMTEGSPALAVPSNQVYGHFGLHESLSLESLETLSTADSDPPQCSAAAQQSDQELFPLGEALSTLYRSSLPADPVRPAKSYVTQIGMHLLMPGRPPSSTSPDRESLTASHDFSVAGGQDHGHNTRGTLEQKSLLDILAGSPDASPSKASNAAFEGRDESDAVASASGREPTATATRWDPGRSSPVSPFAAAAHLPAPDSESSLDSVSFTSTASASDYGSHNPWKDSGYKNEGLGQKARTGGHLKADSSYKQQQLSGPPRPVKLEYGQAGTQGRSQLRKRDFETELLERLLGHGTKGPAYGQHIRALPQEMRMNWKAMGLPKMAFVTIIFVCLALFLLMFSAGRLHAQRILRATPLLQLTNASTSALPVSTAMASLPDSVGVKKHQGVAAGTSRQQVQSNFPESASSSGQEAAKAHDRRSANFQAGVLPENRKHLVGDTSLEPKL